MNFSFAERKINMAEIRAEYAAGRRGGVGTPPAGHIHSVQVGKAALREGRGGLRRDGVLIIETNQSRRGR